MRQLFLCVFVDNKHFIYNNLSMKKIILYTDGACSGNPGDGGWGCVLDYMGNKKELSGFEANTTNNRMELMAVLSGLKALKEPCEVEVFSDSAYVVNAFTEDWITSWQLNNWRTADKKPVKNVDLWDELLNLLQVHKVKFNKVKGHADNELNNRCDFLATNQIAINKK